MPLVHLPLRTPPCVEPIEPRWLFSADPVPVVPVAELSSALVQLQTPTAPSAPIAPSSTSPAGESPSNADSSSAGGAEWVIIDARVADRPTLVDDLERQRAEGRDIRWIELTAEEDGVSRISELLAASGEPVRALHLISHSNTGELELGSTTISLETIRQRAGEFAGWSVTLGDDADLLIYGCDLAAGPDGSELVDALAALTGADIAASTDATGHTRLGGDWQLEHQTGEIETPAAFSAAAQQDWGGLLLLTDTGTETLVNTNATGGKQNLPADSGGQQIASNGTYTVIVWEDSNQIWARLSNEVSNTHTFVMVAGGAQMQDASVAMDASGNFVVVWSWGGNQDGDGKGIYAQRYNPAGATIGSPIQVNTVETANDQTLPAVTFLSDGNFAVSWTSDFGSHLETRLAVFEFATANLVSAEQQVNETTANDQTRSSIAASGDGRIMVVWQSKDQIGTGWSVLGRTFDNAGGSASNEVSLAAYTSGEQIAPSVGGGDSQFVVSYAHDEGSGSQYTYARIFTTAGTASAAPVRVDESTGSNQSNNTAIGVAPDGSFVVSWWENYDQPYIRDFNSFGVPSAPGRDVVADLSGPQDHPTLHYDGSTVRIAWDGKGPGDNDGVFTRSFTVDTPGFSLLAPATPTTSEAGGTVSVGVSLNSAPAGTVVVTLTSSNTREGQITSGSTLTFTAGNFATVQTVTLTGVDDLIDDGDRNWQVSISAASTDLNYSGTFGPPIDIVNTDDDSFSTITVDTTSDTADGTTSSLWDLWNNRGADGKISLREAITAANNSANGTSADRIRFDHASLGGSPIQINSDLPTINDVIDIDGRLSPTDTGPGVRILNNFSVPTGLRFDSAAAGSEMRGLSLTGFSWTGAQVNAASVTVEYNNLGVALDGSAAGNNYGLRVEASGVVVRGNVIGSNSADGLYLDNASGTRIENNIIGITPGQTAPRGNVGNGIQILNSNGIQIFGNVVGSNVLNGLSLHNVDGAVIQGNYFGANATNTMAAGNFRNAIFVGDSSSGNRVGGTNGAATLATLNEGNFIAHNGWAGVQIVDGTGPSVDNVVIGNLIDDNGFGIDLAGAESAPSRVDHNDTNDADSGPNNLQNSPVLTAVVPTGANSVEVTGSLHSTANTNFRVEFFLDATVTGGNGEGPTTPSVVNLTTDASGNAAFVTNMNFAVPATGWMTATATRLSADNSQQFSTSEFSVPTRINTPPTWVSPAANVFVPENTTAVASLVASDTEDAETSLTYALTSGVGSPPDNAFFQIINDAGTRKLEFIAAPDYEAGHGPDYAIELQVTDTSGGVALRSTTVRVTDVNEAPSAADITRAISENQTYTFTPIEFSGVFSDPDGGDGLAAIRIDSVPGIGEGSVQYSVALGVWAPILPSGIVTVSDLAAGKLAYVPANGASGTPVTTFQYSVRDAAGLYSASPNAYSFNISAVDDPPVLLPRTAPTVAEGAAATITNTHLHATDVDNSPSELLFEIVSAPVNGSLRVNGVAQTAGGVFTQQQIDDSLVSYQHNGLETTADTIELRLSSNGQTLPDFFLDINITPADDPAVIVNNTGATLDEGASVTLGSGQLLASDPDTADSGLVYRIRTAPTHGSLLLSGLPQIVGATFTQAQVNSGQVTFAHDGSETTSASAALELNSGAHPSIGLTVGFTINALDDPPVLVQNTDLVVNEGGAAVLLRSDLEVTDADNTASGLQYTLVRSAAHGVLSLDGVDLSTGSTFTQADINTSKLVFRHDGSEPVADSFELTLDSQTFTMTGIEVPLSVQPTNDPPDVSAPLLMFGQEDTPLVFGTSGPTQVSVSDPDAGAVIDINLSANRGTVSLASTAGLMFSSGDGADDAQMVFRGAIANVNAALAGLAFSAPANESGFFTLRISGTDPVDNSTDVGLVLMTIQARNDAPVLVNRVDLLLDQVRDALIDTAHLKVTDVEDGPGDIQYTIRTLPSSLNVIVDQQKLDVGEHFTQQQIDEGRVQVSYVESDSGEAELVLEASDSDNARIGDLRLKVVAQLAPVTGAGSSSGTTSLASTTSATSAGSASAAPGSVAVTAIPPEAGGSREQRVFVPSGDDSATRRSASVANLDGKNAAGFRTAANTSNAQRQTEAFMQGSSMRETMGEVDRRRGFDNNPKTSIERLRRTDSGAFDGARSEAASVRYSEQARAQRSAALREGLSELRERIDERINLERNVVASSVAVTSGLSIGYVIWLLRGGVLLSSMLAAIPAWQSIDPLPVLSRFSDGNGGEDDDSLEEMLEKSRKVDRQPVAPAASLHTAARTHGVVTDPVVTHAALSNAALPGAANTARS